MGVIRLQRPAVEPMSTDKFQQAWKHDQTLTRPVKT